MPGQSVQFVDLSVPGSSPITAWLWNFGDGGTSTLSNPSHVYTASGIYTTTSLYTVSLTVTTAVGMDSEIKSNFISVQP